MGDGRYFAYDHPDEARSEEITFMVLDRYQGQGIATSTMRHLLVIASANRITQFEAEVLPEMPRCSRSFPVLAFPCACHALLMFFTCPLLFPQMSLNPPSEYFDQVLMSGPMAPWDQIVKSFSTRYTMLSQCG